MAVRFYQNNWNSGVAKVSVRSGLTEFEQEVQRLGLKPDEYKVSLSLRIWVKRHRNYKYVPESLLIHWGLEVDELWG